jgi:release factor glutamine methyltransferase
VTIAPAGLREPPRLASELAPHYHARVSNAGTDTAWTVARLLAWTREHLQKSGRDAPRLSAEILLAHAMHCERIQLFARFEQVPGEDVLGPFRELVRQAAAGHPIAYLTGTKEFFSLPHEVTPDVLIPRPETEMLVERTIDLVRKAGAGGPTPAILDLGTGSGCVAVALARHLPQARVFASDLSSAALAVARRNAARHGVAARIEFRAGDLLGPWSGADGQPVLAPFDLVVSNPPYVATEAVPVEPAVREFEPATALFAGRDGLDVIRRIAAESPARLAPGGWLLLEIAFNQAAAVRDLLAAQGFVDILTFRDGAGHERIVRARRP